ncbi:hypothetical protein HY837_04040 [archaeon]|nr:hypothetical protein [archaeon]
MEIVSFKLQEVIIKQIDRVLKQFHFNNRTEFIREAIRSKLIELETDPVLKALRKFQGAAKVKVSDERLEEIREQVFRKHAKKFGVELD